MSTHAEAATIGLTHGGSEDTGLGHRGPESKSIVVPYGFWLLLTGLLGLVFLSIEMFEFAKMIGEGAGPQRSAFLSSFFTLVGCHGAHVTAGLLWLGTMMAQIWAKGFRQDIMRRLLCYSVF